VAFESVDCGGVMRADTQEPRASTPRWVVPVVLEGRIVRLEPLSENHLEGLADVAFEPSIWQWTLARPTNRAGLRTWLEAALSNAAAGTELPFTTIDQASGQPIGSTRFLSIVPEHRRLEIGWTWLGRAWQRTGANREAKLLLLGHAFDELGANRVEFKTDSRNEPSRTALLGIGATFEGIFRNHMVMPDGPLRHSAYYSVISDEWPAVRDRLEASLANRR
jgi:RimJ/RimL family protein N-acetyltransferase